MSRFSYKTLILILLFLLIPIVLFFRLSQRGKQVSAEWFNDSWNYRQRIDITNSSGSDLTDFQVSFDIGTSALIAAGKMQSDCDDIRITDQNGNLLPYWIETNGINTCNQTSTKIWVKTPSLPTSGAPVYVYYGNSTASAVANGNDVFEFFDDFSGTSIDAAKWTQGTTAATSGTNFSQSSGNLVGGNTNRYIQSLNPFTGNYIAETRVYTTTSPANGYSSIGFYSSSSNSFGILDHNSTSYYRNDAGWAGFAYNGSGQWNHDKVSVIGTSATYWRTGETSGALTGSATNSGLNSEYLRLGARYDGTNNNQEYSATWDWIFVRKAVTTQPTATPASEEVGGGPIAYWKFDEGVGTTAYDSTSNNTHGTFGIGGSAPTWVTEDQCISGKCLSFDGTNDRIIISKSIPIAPNPGFTITHWIKTSASGNGVYTIGNAGGSSGYRFGITQGKVSFLIGNGTYDETTCGNVLVNDNKWHQITGIYTTTTFKCFVDGEIDNTINISDRTGMPTTAPRIGDPPCCTDFSGLLDEVKIFPYARTADQIKADYASGLAGMGSSSDSSVNIGGASTGKSLSNGLVGYWKMDETSSPSLDYSGRGYSATWNGDAASGAGKFGNGITQSHGGGGNLSVSDTGDPHDMGTGNFSVAMWFKLNSLDLPDAPELFDKMFSAETGYHLRVGYNNEVELMVKGTNGTVETNSANSVIQTGTWYHVTAVYDKTNGHKIYLNGTQSGSTVTGDAGNIDNSDPLRFGMGFNGWEMDGTYDEVRLYNRALSPTEVKQLYEYAPGPVAYWKFEEGSGSIAYDSSGNNKNGTMNNFTSSSWVPGKYGKALQFNGTSSYISGFSVPGPYQFTWEAWIKPNTAGCADRCSIIDRYFELVGGSLQYYSYQLTTPGWHSSASVFQDKQWQYATVSYDGSTLKLYRNGIPIYQTNTTATGNMVSAIEIGANATSRYFDGLIDEVKIYNYARNQKQILEDMAGSPPSSSSTKVSTPLVHYKFDEGYGSIVNNSGSIGSTLNGTLGTGTSSPAWTQGKFKKSLTFGGNDYVSTPDPGTNSALDITESLTLSAWINPSATDTYRTILNKGNNYEIGSLNGRLYFIYYNSGWKGWQATNISVTTNAWQHVAAVVTFPNQCTLYYNGQPLSIGFTWGTGDPTTDNNPLTIGMRSASSYPFSGSIDEVKIYNYALSADEVKQDYNQGSTFVFGSSNQTIGATTTSLDYCLPGDTSPCSPPVAEWKFEEGVGTTAYDTSGNNNDGTLINSPTWTTGKIGKGLGFNGTNTYSRINRIINDSFTISVWFNTTDTGSGGTDYRWYKGDGLVDSETVGVVNDFGISHHSNGYIIAGVGNPDVHVISNPGLNDGKWHFAEFTRDINTGIVKLYIDGSLVDTNTGNTSSLNSTLYTDIGRIQTGVNYFSGKLDQIRIYDYARTPAQIAYDYNQGAPVGHWKLDECQGTAIHDSSGNNNHGTLSIGASGTQTTPGTCPAAAGAWYNGKLGKINSSLNFDGSDDYVPVTGFKPQVSNGFTASAWFKTNSSGVRRFVINQWGGGGAGNASWGIEMNTSNQIVFETYSGANAYLYTTSNTYNNSSWNHVVITYNGTSMKSYINGTLLDTRNATVQNSTNYDLHIGQEASGGEYWLGQIDDVRVYNYDLTATQVKTLYNNGSINFR